MNALIDLFLWCSLLLLIRLLYTAPLFTAFCPPFFCFIRIGRGWQRHCLTQAKDYHGHCCRLYRLERPYLALSLPLDFLFQFLNSSLRQRQGRPPSPDSLHYKARGEQIRIGSQQLFAGSTKSPAPVKLFFLLVSLATVHSPHLLWACGVDDDPLELYDQGCVFVLSGTNCTGLRTRTWQDGSFHPSGNQLTILSRFHMQMTSLVLLFQLNQQKTNIKI